MKNLQCTLPTIFFNLIARLDCTKMQLFCLASHYNNYNNKCIIRTHIHAQWRKI